MKLRKEGFERREELFKYYRAKTLEELQVIKPKWAIEENADSILNSTLHPVNNEFSIFFVATIELIENTEFDDFNLTTLFTGEDLNDYRITLILFRWHNNTFVDPPSISLSNSSKNKLAIDDGRHRTKLAWLLGHNKIPVAIHNTQIEAIGKIVKLVKV